MVYILVNGSVPSLIKSYSVIFGCAIPFTFVVKPICQVSQWSFHVPRLPNSFIRCFLNIYNWIIQKTVPDIVKLDWLYNPSICGWIKHCFSYYLQNILEIKFIILLYVDLYCPLYDLDICFFFLLVYLWEYCSWLFGSMSYHVMLRVLFIYQ